ncbi:MAG: nuclear transport factor 2 family protein [Vicingaceae bacterium]|nr:nuclear transport factor 2 family protein [Vicingaceae bacterium]
MKNTIYILLIFLTMACTQQFEEKEAILQVMSQQEQDWNNGNIDAFMQGYWQSDSLMFVGKNGIKYGWQTTLENYKKSYPDKSTMGNLSFAIEKLEVENQTAFMLGKWNITRESDNIGGYFTLYWKKIDGKWVIVLDHTS